MLSLKIGYVVWVTGQTLRAIINIICCPPQPNVTLCGWRHRILMSADMGKWTWCFIPIDYHWWCWKVSCTLPEEKGNHHFHPAINYDRQPWPACKIYWYNVVTNSMETISQPPFDLDSVPLHELGLTPDTVNEAKNQRLNRLWAWGKIYYNIPIN